MATRTSAKEKLFNRAKERIEECKERNRNQHERIREDMRFSNPAAPEQWDRDSLSARQGRHTLTLDRTNQFVMQVVNDARQSNPGVQVIPVDNKADVKAAEVLGGMFRHIEYQSRAGIAYDTAIEHSARSGLGWLRAYPVEHPVTGEIDIRIGRVIDPTAAGLDPNSTEPDGSDAEWAYVETRMTRKAFERAYPKAKPVTFADGGWKSGDNITVAEYFEILSQPENIITSLDEEGQEVEHSEDDHWAARQSGELLQPVAAEVRTKRTVRWVKMTGAEILEQTEFPSQYLPIVPVLGYELWVDGERHLCGLVRRLMDGQRLHNYQMSAMAEFLATQPKAPFMVPVAALEGNDADWKKLNRGNPSVLPYNHVDSEGQPIPAPQRLMPPPMPGAYAQMAQFAVSEMEASVGMYKANLGQQGNETSGRAIRARQMEGDTATFHFIDNLSRSIEQLARVIIDMIPRIYTEDRIAHIVGQDGKRDMVAVRPTGPAVRKDQSGKVTAINPQIGTYDVRVKTGPSYTTQREEAAQQLADMMQAQPNLAPILGPMWAKLRDMPESEKIAKLLLAMAPPQVQQIEEEGDAAPEIPPQVQAKLQQQEQAMQQMEQAMNAAADKLQELQSTARKDEIEALIKTSELQIKEYQAETDRIKALATGMTAQDVQALVMQTIQQAMQREPLGDAETVENYVQQQIGMEDEPHMRPPDESPMHEAQEPPGIEQQEQTEPAPEVGFSLGEQPNPDLGQEDPMNGQQ